MTSREFNLDGTRLVDEKLTADEPATVLSCLYHYIARPTTSEFESATLLHFVQHYSMPRQGRDPKPRNKVVAIVHPYLLSDCQIMSSIVGRD